jgi:predicted DNA-binding protein (UPF0251 family)
LVRKRCCGVIEQVPCCRQFSPVGQDDSGTIKVLFEEIEAIRLKDVVGLDQVTCAVFMGLSRATFQRILRSARFKVAKALVEGKHMIFEGGHYIMKNRVFECLDCGKRWEESPCTAGGRHGYEIACPGCGSMKKSKVEDDGKKTACGGHQHQGSGGCCGGHSHGGV